MSKHILIGSQSTTILPEIQPFKIHYYHKGLLKSYV